MIQKHRDYTGSKRATQVLADWDSLVGKFVKVMPKDYKRVLQALKEAEQSGLSGAEAINAAFEANASDEARIGGS
jgi:glutamate synthase (ferredoxin)